METSLTSSGSAESRLIHRHRIFPLFNRGRIVERNTNTAKAPETIDHEGERLTQREVIAKKEKKMEEMHEKIKKAREAKDALKKKIEQKDHDSPFPDGYNYAHDIDAVKILEKEIANLEQKVQKIDSTSWRSAMNAVKDAEQAHEEILNNIYNVDNQVAESGELDAERNERRAEYMAQADEQFSWVQNNLEGKAIDVQYMNVSGDARIGSGAKQLIERAKSMEALADKYDALKGKISRDENFISRLRTAAQKCRDLFPAMNEHEQGIMKMQKQNVEKQQELSPRVLAWKQKAETFKKWNELEAKALAAKNGGVTIVDNWIRAGKELQTEFQALSSVLDGTDAAFNFDIGNNALPQLENLKNQVKEKLLDGKIQNVLEQAVRLRQGFDGHTLSVEQGLQDVRSTVQSIVDMQTEMKANNFLPQRAGEITSALEDMQRLQAEMGDAMSVEQTEREADDKKLIQQADGLMEAPLNLFDAADLRAHITQIETLLTSIYDRLRPGSTFTSSYNDLENRANALSVRLSAAQERQRLPETWVNFRSNRHERLVELAKGKIQKASETTDATKRAQLLADADFFKAEAQKVFAAPMNAFKDSINAERTTVPAKREQLTAQLNLYPAGSLGRLTTQRLIEALPTDLDSVPDMA